MLLAGCASPPDPKDEAAVQSYREANDPLEPINRYFFEVNRFLDIVALRPAAEFYRELVPAPVRSGARNVVRNLGEPLTAINSFLQGDHARAGDDLARFAINSTLGIGGIMDVAADPKFLGVERKDEDFGQTLGVYKIDEGLYLMLPILGPRPPRDLIGFAVDSFIEPVQYAFPNELRTGFGLSRAAVSGIDLRERNIETLDDIERNALDFYATIRSLYRQRRNAEIANGKVSPSLLAPEIRSGATASAVTAGLQDDLRLEKASAPRR
ncbi:MAG: VacJ family lipoprotein [Alphaproteobacteria bacterium]|nr:VacJ family lipoprotein [Alphaproteobacteria bacterium]